MVNTYCQRSILFPSNFNDDQFKNDFPFHILESKLIYEFSVAMSYLNKNYVFSLLDYKTYRSNLIINDGFIDHHQKPHRDYEVKFSKWSLSWKKKHQKQEIKIIQLKTINFSIYIYKS